jgi:hypothetical protein
MYEAVAVLAVAFDMPVSCAILKCGQIQVFGNSTTKPK